MGFSLVLGVLSGLFLMAVPAMQGSGLYPVSSIYEDDSQPTQGTGLFLEYKGESRSRYFIVTASHVTGGRAESFQILDKGFSGKVLGRRADIGQDLELFEIEKPAGRQSFAWTNSQLKNIFAYPEAWHHWVSHFGAKELRPSKHVIPIGLWSNVYALIPQWFKSPCKPVPASLELIRKTGGLGGRVEEGPQLGVSADISAAVKIVPGMSGSVIVGFSLESPEYEVRGLVSSFDRYFVSSLFVSRDKLTRLLSDYLKEVPKSLERGRWESKKGLTYRVFPDGTQEIDPVSFFAGNGGTVGGGEAGNGGTVGGGGECKRSKKLEFVDVWEKLGIGAGMRWKGTPNVLGVRHGQSPWIAADIPAYLAYKNHDSLQFVVEGQPLSPLLLSRYQREFRSERTPTLFSFLALPYPVVGKPELGRSELTYDHGKITLFLPFIWPDREDLTLVIDEFGRVEGKDSFRPVVSIVGPKSGKTYIIDLKSLYFTDLSTTTERTFQKDPSAFIKVKRLDLPFEYHIQFIHRKP